MVALRTIALGLAATVATTVSAAQSLTIIWSSGHFSTIAPPHGNGERGHESGFAVTDDQGVELFSADNPGDYAPCFSTDGGRTFTLESTCWSKPRQFHCLATAGGNPENCAVLDQGGNELSYAEGNTDTEFIGVAITQDAACVTSFLLDEDETCDDQAEWTVS